MDKGTHSTLRQLRRISSIPAICSLLVVVLAGPAMATKSIECGGKTTQYGGTPVLSTVIILPDDYNGVSLEPPPATYNTSRDGKIKATYRWEHVGTFATRSGAGKLGLEHWTGVTKTSSVTTGFGFSISASETAGGGVPDLGSVTATVTESFGYSSQVTSSFTEYDKQGLKESIHLQKSQALQVWRLAIDFEVTKTGAHYTVGTQNRIQCAYPLDFSKPMFVRILGEDFKFPHPPTDVNGNVTHYPADPKTKTLKPSKAHVLANLPLMQAAAFYHRKSEHGFEWGWGSGTKNYSWFNLVPFRKKIAGWKDCGLLVGEGPADPTMGLPLYPTCKLGAGCSVRALLTAAADFCSDAEVTRVGCFPSVSIGGCPAFDPDKDGCYLNYDGSDSTRYHFVRDVCHDWSTIAAGGAPTWMNREDWQSAFPMQVTVGWHSHGSSNTSDSTEVEVTYQHGVDSSESHEREFSASLGVAVEAGGDFDGVIVSGKLAATVSASLKQSWGLEVSEEDTKSFEVTLPKETPYDIWGLSAEYQVVTSSPAILKTVSNFIVILDDGGVQ